ncbi:uncharacterized protein E0L32_004310 [Thyridium curvatum]|uniref:Aminoglycoside phosphotransferase domain-containing protein n=1 Tax=Thyridium curvatum TaxID=1093900 RepID=A0A507B052_9PEZI|nr:uncharacterized protein E0L32_004310 [Thyridium curvatum]TPX15612.1 hypothetical protein E0L32_004310 [Thyridium curvatum]
MLEKSGSTTGGLPPATSARSGSKPSASASDGPEPEEDDDSSAGVAVCQTLPCIRIEHFEQSIQHSVSNSEYSIIAMAGRVRHPIDVKSLEAYLNKNVPEIKTPLDIKQFGFGQSNPTYQLTSPTGTRYVLRKKPPGKLVSKTAHKVEREYRILAALAGTDVAVPRTFCLCEDDAVIGTPFYVMEFLDGRIIEDAAIPGVSPRERADMWADSVRTLAKLHRVDPRAVGLETFGRPSGFYARQVNTWKTICAAQSATRDVETGEPVGDLPHFQEMMAFFSDAAKQPRDRGTLIHGDYKIDNLVFHKTEPRVIGILDWEMSTIGHPLSDLSNHITPYFTAHMGSTIHNAHPGFKPGATPGLPDADEVAALYCRTAGWGTASDPDRWPDMARELRWAQAFNIFRQAAICQGIAARVAARQASSEQARRYGDARAALAEYAWELVQAAENTGGSSADKPRL